MINHKVGLVQHLFTDAITKAPTRDGYGKGLLIAGEADDRVVVLCADLTESTRCNSFKKKYPERFIEVGVAEQLLATVASGMANYGKIPFISSYAVFSPGRNWEQIRTTIALNNVPVKIAGSHAGLSVGPDGATHQALEDIALMRVIPNMIVVVPADSVEAVKATVEIAKNNKPSYIRLAREESAVITSEITPFKLGKAEVFWESKYPKVTIIACGIMVYEALLAAKRLSEEGIGSVVINSHTIKPLDQETIIKYAKLASAVVTAEEHQVSGGLGGAISEMLSKKLPVVVECVGVNDSFGESGTPSELMDKYKLNSKEIVRKAMIAISRTKK